MSDTVAARIIRCWCSLFETKRHRNQVVSETVHGEQAAKASICASCVEAESKLCSCKCGEDEAFRLQSEQHGKATSSFAHSVINMIGMLIGLGQLSTPYALENGGWSSVLLLIGLGVMCAYTAHIIGKCLDEDAGSKTYQDIGERAFGSKGRIVASTFIYLEIFFALVSYTISLSDNLPLVLGGVVHARLPWLHLSTEQMLTVMAVLVALPTLWLRDLSSISFLSFGGILMSLLIFATVAWVAVFGGVQGSHEIPALRAERIPGISGLYVFSFAGHIVFPNIYTAMKDPSKFTKVSVTSFAIVSTLYTALAFMGAWLFGPAVSSQITLSLPPRIVATKVALWATVLTPMTKYALEFAPFAIQLEQRLPLSMGWRTRTLIRGGVGSVLLLLVLALALAVPYFEHVLSLTGSLVSVAISVVFPCAFYLRICWARLSRPAVAFNAGLILFGVVLAVAGTVSSFAALLRSIQRAHSH
ncbi:amino acid transporter AVT1H-like [Zingiber officinale]|uniref:Amino acid transporter transmembrane domain-containing protein n=1 Tax=Zingiber officinale TaxID=94328 RepID=A0A8J5CBM6_ZINOF|nr:amino acid transporter AVT1H-like [Zingiber officinale]KAG6471927.1 hypothetical protein ZIOFF_069380 [Zingiber officinale]